MEHLLLFLLLLRVLFTAATETDSTERLTLNAAEKVLAVNAIASRDDSCPCSDPSWCQPLHVPLYSRKEVYSFSLKTDNWGDYDWSIITTMAWFGKVEQLPRQLICMAHQHNARVVFTTSIPESILRSNTTLREQRQWAQEMVDNVIAVGGDGINLDYENPIVDDKPKQQAVTYITNEIQLQLKKKNPYSSLVWDFGWKPNVDVRYYEYNRIADICDFVFLMVYDTQSQIWTGPPCLANANAPISAMLKSLQWYGDGDRTKKNADVADQPMLKIPYEKIILGLPWYGYYYHCVKFDHASQECTIPTVSFRGAPCSDAAGRQIDYPYTVVALEQGQAHSILDSNTMSMKGFVRDNHTGNITAYYYDSPGTIREKIVTAWITTSGRLGGVGMWNADVPNYTNVDEATAFWNAMRVPPSPRSPTEHS